MEKLLKVDELSMITNLKKSTIYAMINQKRIPVVKLSGRCVRFRLSEIEKWLKSLSCDVVSPSNPDEKTRAPKRTVKIQVKSRLNSEMADRLLESAKRDTGAGS